MNRDTTMAKTLRVTDEKAGYDAEFSDDIIFNKIRDKFQLTEETAREYLAKEIN